MRISRGICAIGASTVLAITSIGVSVAATPAATTQITLAGAAGFKPVAEVKLANGAVVDTFASADATLKVIGRPGSSISVDLTKDATTGSTTAAMSMTTTRPKSDADANAYARSGRSAVKDLIALGVPADVAQTQFGDMDTPSGAPPASQAVSSAGYSRATAGASPLVAAAAATSPYDTQCANLSYASGKIVGYGCSTLYLAYKNGADWWFDSKYKLSAHSTDTGIFPQRLSKVGWGLQWSSGNVVYDWDPSATERKGSCTTTTYALTVYGMGVTVSGAVCPVQIGPWNMSSTKSGSIWQGIEESLDYEAALGVQADHNPPAARVSYSSPFTLVFGPY